jgi:hypothetical protein
LVVCTFLSFLVRQGLDVLFLSNEVSSSDEGSVSTFGRTLGILKDVVPVMISTNQSLIHSLIRLSGRFRFTMRTLAIVFEIVSRAEFILEDLE